MSKIPQIEALGSSIGWKEYCPCNRVDWADDSGGRLDPAIGSSGIGSQSSLDCTPSSMRTIPNVVVAVGSEGWFIVVLRLHRLAGKGMVG